ncbi:hypothetical protein B0T16DRAFT_148160 [Cercophora newfieldiana]|uniref:Uncharacterized protein n=1 Tax=Cercophora newfieldiana TaxID=92897 RepID=A0AA40CPG4_9PEZI|nr:hypothetical protein B0T16DRAFT_148160 [Cercophora newfieldiana]
MLLSSCLAVTGGEGIWNTRSRHCAWANQSLCQYLGLPRRAFVHWSTTGRCDIERGYTERAFPVSSTSRLGIQGFRAYSRAADVGSKRSSGQRMRRPVDRKRGPTTSSPALPRAICCLWTATCHDMWERGGV